MDHERILPVFGRHCWSTALRVKEPIPAAACARSARSSGRSRFFPWTIETLASCTAISDSRLHALFLEEFGLSPHRWLAELRLDKVCALLRQSTLPIAEIALRAGFSDQTALTRAMRNAMGETPAAYRRAFGVH